MNWKKNEMNWKKKGEVKTEETKKETFQKLKIAKFEVLFHRRIGNPNKLQVSNRDF